MLKIALLAYLKIYRYGYEFVNTITFCVKNEIDYNN